MTKVGQGRRRHPLLVSGLLLIALAVAFLAAYGVIGSYVDADGTLHEPFALIPLAWLCGLSGATLTAVAVRRRR